MGEVDWKAWAQKLIDNPPPGLEPGRAPVIRTGIRDPITPELKAAIRKRDGNRCRRRAIENTPA